MSKVRVRFAPSPTGYLHVGGARTALFNYLFAKHLGGQFILRVEDTDQARSTDEALKMQIEDLEWLGLQWDEGPDPKTLEDRGPYGPYRQSRRLDIYKQVAEELLMNGRAYYCFLTDEEIESQRAQAKLAGKSMHVLSPYEDWSLEKSRARVQAGDRAVVRFKTKHLKRDFIFTDLIRGEIKFPSDMVGDFVLLRSDGMPVYNFCCVVDDHKMEMSHVLRAEEHLPNTLRQLMVYEGMGWTPPKFGHLSLILDEDRQKLSKRKGATSCHEFKEEGYLPEALKNFVALLGWSHPDEKEIMSMQDMIAAFDLQRINPAGAIFDAVKLKWMNATHLRALNNREVWQRLDPYLQKAGLDLPKDSEWQEKTVNVFRPAMETLAESVELYRPLSDKDFAVLPEADEVYAWESTRAVIAQWRDLIAVEPGDYLSEETFLKVQDLVKEKAGVKGKFLFQPVRVAVIGKPHGSELKMLVPLIAKKSLVKRAEMALAKAK